MTKSEKGLLFNSLAQILENQICLEGMGEVPDKALEQSVTLKNDLMIVVGKLADKPKKSAKNFWKRSSL